MIKKITLFFGYKLIWISGVLTISHGISFLTPLLSVVYFFMIFFDINHRRSFIYFVFFIMAMGVLIEAFIFNRFVYDIVQPTINGFIPTWLIGIWLAFPCMSLMSLGTVLKSRLLSVFIGSISGPLAYQGASRMGAIIIHSGWLPFLILSLVWAAIMLISHILFLRLFTKGLDLNHHL